MDHSAKLGSWGELYVMLGTSSAALIGLLFVAASLHLSEIVNDEIYKIRAQYTTLLLVATLVQATVILTPQPVQWVGAELLIINLYALSVPISLLLKAIKIRKANKRGGFSVHRAVFFISGYVVGIIGSLALIFKSDWGLYPVTVSYVSTLLATIWNAWAIMLGIGQSEKRRTR